MNCHNRALWDSALKHQQEIARVKMKDFTRYTFPNYQFGWFNELLCAELDQFLIDVELGNNPLLMVFAPPRSGKSELCSRRFPAKILGNHPDWEIIGASYSSTLAERMSRDAKRIMMDQRYMDLFPNVQLPQKRGLGYSNTSELWEIVDANNRLTGGSYRAAGVDGGITGQGMIVGIIDDPAKDYKQASSAAYQRAVMDWYDTTFFTRMNPKVNGVMIILTRWHKLDLAGQLLEKAKVDGDKWRLVSFPMEAEEDEIHELAGKVYQLRKKGEILFPERMPPKFVERCKKRGSLVWNALYQQRPTSRGGSMIKTDHFKYYKKLPMLKFRFIMGDTAQKEKEVNDRSCFICFGVGVDGNLYVLDLIKGRWPAPTLETKALAFWKKHQAFISELKVVHNKPVLRFMGIEDKSSGTGLIQTIRKGGTNGKGPKVPIKAIPRNRDKVTRVKDIQGFIESGYVYLPDIESDHSFTDGTWLSDFLMECEDFSEEMTHAHDDQVDPLMDGIEHVFLKSSVSVADWN